MKRKFYLFRFVKKQTIFRKMLSAASFFIIISDAYSQNPLLLQQATNGGTATVSQIIATATGKTFYNTTDPVNTFTDAWGLWATDGTTAGTQKLTLQDGHFITTEATMLTPLGNNKILFAGDNESGYGEIWVSDGTQAGTFGLQNFVTGISGGPVQDIASIGDKGIYAAISGDSHLRLHSTTGASYADTSVLYDFGKVTSSQIALMKTVNDIVYFDFYDLDNGGNDIIWRTDGTAAGTFALKDLGASGSYLKSYFMPAGNNVYFVTEQFDNKKTVLFKTDGTAAGAVAVKTISTVTNTEDYPSFAAINSTLYFSINDGTHGNELWQTDGTDNGTSIAADINNGATGSYPDYLTVLNNVLYFSADDGVHGAELWDYNPNNSSAEMVKDIYPGATGSNPSSLATNNNTLVFSATSNTNDGAEFWASGGDATNTLEIDNIAKPAGQSSAPGLFTSGNKNFFVALEDVNGDGTINNEECIFAYTPPDKIWTGAINTDVSAIDNWFPSGTPSSTDNVLIPYNAPTGISGGLLQTKDITNHGLINLDNSGIVLVNGDFYNDNYAAVLNTMNGIFAVSGEGDHWIGNNGIYNGQLTISGGANAHLTTDFTVNDFRNDGGTIYLDSHNFKFDTYTNFPPKIITGNGGTITGLVGPSPVIFGVGTDTSSYTPVTITNNGTQDYFSVNVKNGVFKNGTSGDSITREAVNKTWYIEKQTSGNANADITLQWNTLDELAGFNVNSVYLNHYTSGAWDSGTPGMASGTDPYTFTRTGITSFSPFSISSSASVLPVNLISFTAEKINRAAELNWQTNVATDARSYIVERSVDGIDFSKIGEVQPNLQKNYSFIDNSPLAGINFYRLKMMNMDDKYSYSKVIAIKMDASGHFLIFPNPVKNILHVQVNAENNSNAMLRIFDMNGRLMQEEKIGLRGTTSLSIDVSNLPAGNYDLTLKGSGLTEKQLFLKE